MKRFTLMSILGVFLSLSAESGFAKSGTGILYSSRSNVCVASLVRPGLVLTALHCLVAEDGKTLIASNKVKFSYGASGYSDAQHHSVVGASFLIQSDALKQENGISKLSATDVDSIELEHEPAYVILESEIRESTLGLSAGLGSDEVMIYSRMQKGKSEDDFISLFGSISQEHEDEVTVEVATLSDGVSGSPILQNSKVIGIMTYRYVQSNEQFSSLFGGLLFSQGLLNGFMQEALDHYDNS